MFSLLILLFILNLNSYLLKVIIPFTTIKENYTTSGSPSTFMFFYYPNKIETQINIGTPYQKISLRIKTLRIPFSINSVQMGTYQITRFNESDSSSYIPLSSRATYYGENDFSQAIKSKDLITFNNNNLILKNFTFLLGVDGQYYYKEAGVLGLNIAELDWRVKDVGFIKQLKENDLINKYTFFIKYNDKDDDGEIIIDALPHEIDSKKFNKNNFEEFYAEMVSSSMGLKVDEAYYGDILVDCEFDVELAVEDNFIQGTEIFKEALMEAFFKEKITRKICQKSIFTYLTNDNLEFFYCSKKLNISEFQNIYLSILGTELKIELSYKDLFYEYEDNYYFLMYFPTKFYSYIHFRLGKIFFKKYILTFNHDTKMIGYYKTDKKENDEGNDKENDKEDEDEGEKEGKTNKNGSNTFNKYIPWIIIVILVIIVLILGIYILYYKPWRNREKRANELQDDNYTYNEAINNGDGE